MEKFNNLSLGDYTQHFSFFEQVKYLSISIIVFMLCYSGFDSISLSFLFALFIAYWITYYSLENSYTQKTKEITTLKHKLDLINTSKLDLIYNDLDALNLYSSLIEYKEYNKIDYIKSMKHYNNFLEIKDYIKSNVAYTGDYLDLAETEAKNALNSLASINLSLPDAYFAETQQPITITLESGVAELAKIIDKNLYVIYVHLDNKWKTEEVNCASKPVFYSPVEHNMLKTPHYSKNYSLY